MTVETATKKFICMQCGWIYDPEEGIPELGIEPGTAFLDLPESFFCPVCGATKEHFSPM
jgi:rubredoxin